MSLTIENNEIFWGTDPCILFQKNKLLQFIPDKKMSIEEKINSITRFSIYISIILTLYSNKISYILTEIIILIIIYLYYYQNYTNKKVNNNKKLNNENLVKEKKFRKTNIKTLKYQPFHIKNINTQQPILDKLYNNISENSLPISYFKIKNQNGNETVNFAEWLYT